MQALLGPEFPAFVAALHEAPPVSVRWNRFKVPAQEAVSFPDALEPVPWHPEGFYLPERPVFTLDPLFHAGAYYVQEASSMFLYEALRQTTDFSQPLKVLDLCAAPGGKSTLLASMLGADSLLVANETIRQRVGVLRENLEKWGRANIAVTQAESDDFAGLGGWFDVVVTDAPCSGEGLFRKDPGAIREWSPAHVDLCAGRQRRILAGAAAALAPGGVLVYSTCTYNQQEDEENALWLNAEFPLTPVPLNIPVAWGISETAGGGYRFLPHRLRGEGFFIAVFRKNEAPAPQYAPPTGYRSLTPLPRKQQTAAASWLRPDVAAQFFQTPAGTVLALPAAVEPQFRLLDQALKNKWFGVETGVFKGADFIPAHALALSAGVSPTLPAIDLSLEQALRYLKKETFELPPGAPATGWALARYGGLNLGWLKALPNRWNNYLPPERRIRMDI